MPEWLTPTIESNGTLSVSVLAIRLSVALLCGIVVAGSYRITQGHTSMRSMSLMATLVLLTILIAMVTLAIGNSVARAFSLVGALSIVRFRTVVEDTRDTAFVIFAVAIGMAVGAGYFAVPLIGIPLTTFAAYLFRPRETMPLTGSLERTLNVRIGLGRDASTLLDPVFQTHLKRWELKSISTIKQGSAFSLSYQTQLQTDESAIPLVTELNQLEGVQEIELQS